MRLCFSRNIFRFLSLYFIRTAKLLIVAHLNIVGEDNICFADVALRSCAVPQSNVTCSENKTSKGLSMKVIERGIMFLLSAIRHLFSSQLYT